MSKIDTLQAFYDFYEIDQTDSLDQERGGSIYRAIDTNQKEWAVKISEVHINFDKGLLLERYTIAKTLEHINLLEYKAAYRFGTDILSNVAVMPIIDGESLDRYIALGEEDKFLIAEQVIDGLHYLHQKGIVWQNLSAKHILIKKEYGNYIPVFINYGNKMEIPLAFFADYEYLAPEQLLQNEKITKQTDIWSLGVLLYKMWTGRLPFGEKSASLPNAKIKERILGDWEFGLIDNIPAPYQEIVKKCLCREIDERWADCGEIIAVIKAWYSQGNSTQNINIPNQNKEKASSKKILRKPNKPIIWWRVVLAALGAALLGYWVNRL